MIHQLGHIQLPFLSQSAQDFIEERKSSTESTNCRNNS